MKYLNSFKGTLIFFLLGFLMAVSCLYAYTYEYEYAFAYAYDGAKIKKKTVNIKGLSESVEIIKDRWGISHIYAQNQKDLFFAQGFNVARDRLFQLEIWRRKATGTLAEIQGPRALEQDIGARLLRARVNMKKEMKHYHPQGEEIITSFVRGINAYTDLALENPKLLPLEFHLLGLKPGHWTPEAVISRHNGLFRNVRFEIALARTVKILGPQKVKNLLNLHPGDPSLDIEEGIEPLLIPDDILELYSASRSRVRFGPEDIIDPTYRANQSLFRLPGILPSLTVALYHDMNLGSNNWVVTGELTSTGHPMILPYTFICSGAAIR